MLRIPPFGSRVLLAGSAIALNGGIRGRANGGEVHLVHMQGISRPTLGIIFKDPQTRTNTHRQQILKPVNSPGHHK